MAADLLGLGKMAVTRGVALSPPISRFNRKFPPAFRHITSFSSCGLVGTNFLMLGPGRNSPQVAEHYSITALGSQIANETGRKVAYAVGVQSYLLSYVDGMSLLSSCQLFLVFLGL